MKVYEFIFSEKKSIRRKRHIIFWLVYCTYFFIQSLAPRKYSEFFDWETYYFAFLNLCCFAPVFIFAVYFFIYYLLPRTLQKKKYGRFVLGFMVAYIIGTVINYFCAGIFLNSVRYSVPVDPNFQHRMEFGNYNTRWGMIIATIALGMKLSKNLYLQQKENLEITRRKTRAEMQVQKSRIHPEFLQRSLHSIHTDMQSGAKDASSMILILSDILSYSLYEGYRDLVPVENELKELQHLITLEMLNKEKLVDINMQIEGSINDGYIAPMLIVKMVEETITALHHSEIKSFHVSIHLLIIKNRLSLKLSVTGVNENILTNMKYPFVIEHTKTRLGEYYSIRDYKIELVSEKNEINLKLYLQLYTTPTEIKPVSNITSIATNTSQ